MTTIELTTTRQLAVGDTLVNAAGAEYEVTRLARLGKEVRDTWREAQRLRRSMAGPTEE